LIVRRPYVIGASILTVIAAVAMTAGGRTEEGDATVRAVRDDLVISVDLNGSLRAVESSVLTPPQVRDVWRFKISMMVEEGVEVSAGQPVLSFDTSELQQRLQAKLADLDSAQAEVEKKRIDLEVTISNDRLALAEVEARLRKARLIADRPDQLYSNNDVEKARLDLELAELEVDLVRRRIESTRTAGEEELAVLEANLARVESEVAQIRNGIQRMQRTAPRDGIVVYATDWRNEKKKIGDSCWVAEPVLEIPDLSLMEVDGEIEEAEAGHVQEGQTVSIRLDAFPDREYRGTVTTLSRAVQQKSWRNPLKIVKLTISLEETDPERMRPGMRVRGTVEIERRGDAVLVPVSSVFTDAGATRVYRRNLFGWRAVPVELGRRNAEQVEVLSGIEPGDLLLLEPRE
jgi:multidrug efflux pump subunit AcrA (membrane-fusion protein)